MTWQFLYRDSVNFLTDPLVKLPLLLNHDAIALVVASSLPNRKPFMSIRQEFFIEGLGSTLSSDSTYVGNGCNLVRLASQIGAYRLWIGGSSRYPNRVNFSIWVPSMPLYNPASITPPKSTTATSSTVASSATSVSILASNSVRVGATIRNASTQTLYLDFDSAASTTDYAVALDPGGFYEVPYGFTGALSGIWAAANGNALVREFT